MVLWVLLGAVVLAGCAVIDWRGRHRRARRYARHPWRTGMAVGLLYAMGPLIGEWHDSPQVAIVLGGIGGAIATLIHAVGWGPEGYQRLRYIRRYGAPSDWLEHRWLPEGSNWPY